VPIRLALLVALLGLFGSTQAAAQPAPAAGSILAPAARQAGWLNLDAPRPRPLTRLVPPAYVADVDVSAAGDAVLAVYSPLQDRIGGDLLRLDLGSGATAPLVVRADAQESLAWPAWAGGRLLFQREDLSVPATGYAYQASARFPSRIESVQADGSGRGVVVDDARQPGASADGTQLAYVRTSRAGSALVVRGVDDTDERELIAPGTLTDIASPRFSPGGDQLAFAVATPFVGQRLSPLEHLFGVTVAFAHGLPWDLWLAATDGSNAHLLAALGADDPSLAWSPDGRQLFVYSGTGSFIVDATTAEVARYPYLSGYGSVAWVP
jgi:hypothetical protein